MLHITRVLLAEDDETDVLLFQRACKNVNLTAAITVCRDGQEAIDHLETLASTDSSKLPSLIILGLKMPRKSGLHVLKWLRNEPLLKLTPTFIFSTSNHPRDIDTAYALGANGYLVKPASIAERDNVFQLIKSWTTHVQLPSEISQGISINLPEV